MYKHLISFMYAQRSMVALMVNFESQNFISELVVWCFLRLQERALSVLTPLRCCTSDHYVRSLK